MTTRRTRTSAAKEGADHDAVAVTQTTVAAVPSSPSASVSPASPWIAPLLCLRSSSFGVAGSVAAKIGLTDEWTEGVVQRIQQAATGATMIVVGSNSSSREMDDDSAALAHAAWIHTLLFYIVRVSFVLLKLYLDGRMLQLFVAAMHASNSLLASTYNQCCAVVLAVSDRAHARAQRRISCSIVSDSLAFSLFRFAFSCSPGREWFHAVLGATLSVVAAGRFADPTRCRLRAVGQ